MAIRDFVPTVSVDGIEMERGHAAGSPYRLIAGLQFRWRRDAVAGAPQAQPSRRW